LPSPLPEVGKSTAGPPGTADAVLASDNDKPAAPNTGKALLRRFRFDECFVCDIRVLQLFLIPNASFATQFDSLEDILPRRRVGAVVGPVRIGREI